MIENVLYDYIELRKPKGGTEEKRRYPRKNVSAPALVTDLEGVVHAGMINNISLGGIHIPSANNFQQEMRKNARYPSYSPCLKPKSPPSCNARRVTSVPTASQISEHHWSIPISTPIKSFRTTSRSDQAGPSNGKDRLFIPCFHDYFPKASSL